MHCCNEVYAITNCHRLKYLSYGIHLRSEGHVTLPSSSGCHLHQLCIESSQYANLSAPSIHVLSSHGELKHVALFVRSVPVLSPFTLIDNSPNLILLYIVTKEPLCDENDASGNWEDYMDTIAMTFSYHKLPTAGDFMICKINIHTFLDMRY